MLASKPILISANGEVSRLAKKNKVGLVSNAENSKKLAENIINVSKFKSLHLKKIKKNCLNFYNKSYNINTQTQKLIKIMNDA